MRKQIPNPCSYLLVPTRKEGCSYSLSDARLLYHGLYNSSMDSGAPGIAPTVLPIPRVDHDVLHAHTSINSHE